MLYKQWFQNTVKTVAPVSELQLYFRMSIFGIVIFGLTYVYTAWLQVPGVLNKSVADTSVILIGLSMLLSGLCYFLNIFDKWIVYRKHLGLVGFAFGVVHVLLSMAAFERLLEISTWQENAFGAPLTGLIALIIFSIMALISNQYSATHFGGRWWRFILRTGYIGLIFVFAHVFLLKSIRWVAWYQDGMQTPPSMSLLVSIFIVVVVLMRILLWFALKRKAKQSLPRA